MSRKKNSNKYRDRYGIIIDIFTEESFSSVTLYIPKINPLVAGIDDCICTCIGMIDKLFIELDKKNNRKMAKRWLWRKIKDLNFGDTGYKVKDLYNRSKSVDYDYIESIDENEKYWKQRNSELKKKKESEGI